MSTAVATPTDIKERDRRTHKGARGKKHPAYYRAKNRALLHERLPKITSMFSKGHTIIEIAKELGVQRKYVRTVINKMEEELIKRGLFDVDKGRARAYNSINLRIKTLWEQWELTTVTKNGEPCQGNLAIMAMINDLERDKRDLLGLDMPKKVEMTGKAHMVEWATILTVGSQLAPNQLEPKKDDSIEDKIKNVGRVTVEDNKE